jgi:hypothetical protein
VWELRRSASLLLANGHPEAYDYPIGLLQDETRFVSDRVNSLEVTRAILLRMAVSTIFSKEAGKQFTKSTTELAELTGVIDGSEGR